MPRALLLVAPHPGGQVDEIAERQHVESRTPETALTRDSSSTADRGMRWVAAHGSSWNP